MTDPVRVIAFPGAPNLPTFAAIEQGYFAAEGLDVSIELTPSSVYQAEKTAAGEFDIVFTAFDNVVAYGEGQGAAGDGVDPEYRVIAGATQLELSLVVAADIKKHADLKGRSIALDALTTGFAFVLFDMLEKEGISPDDVKFEAIGATPQRWNAVKAGESDGTLTIEPFTSIAERLGFSVLDRSTRIYDAYQGGIVAARRSFAETHPDRVTAFLRAYLKGLAWVRDVANHDAAQALLLEKMTAIQPQAAPAVMKSLLSPKSGLTPEAAILPEGMQQVLALRSRYGTGSAPLTDYEKYLDLSFLKAASAGQG
jgi:ABC-type nitrate/sulfonate/bicarbonate transport system substrate-binding protein